MHLLDIFFYKSIMNKDNTVFFVSTHKDIPKQHTQNEAKRTLAKILNTYFHDCQQIFFLKKNLICGPNYTRLT